jgi:feruloyl esterase
MTVAAKALLSAFYRTRSFRSYFEGCSTGGQQALVEAQRFPDDYDGILAGAPGNNRTRGTAYYAWTFQAVNEQAGGQMTDQQWSAVTAAVLAACAGRDGGAPGDEFLTDPRQCRFAAERLPRCAANTRSGKCFSPPQLAALVRLYGGARNPRTAERIYPGLTLGSESMALGPARMNDPAAASRLFILRWAFGKTFDPRSFDFDGDMDRLDAKLGRTLNATDADLSRFALRGGKLLLYNGLADPGVPFADTVNYYERVLSRSGFAHGRGFARLYLVPGMGHCFGGPGATDFGQPLSPGVPDGMHDVLAALVQWVERERAPDSFLAVKDRADGRAIRERLICAYPDLPSYLGGDRWTANSFSCRRRHRGSGQEPATRYAS